MLCRADLLALTTTASGNGEALPGYPVGALVSYAIDLARDRVALWCGMGHGRIMDEQGGISVVLKIAVMSGAVQNRYRQLTRGARAWSSTIPLRFSSGRCRMPCSRSIFSRHKLAIRHEY